MVGCAAWTTRRPAERHLNIHFSPEIMAGVYANFANVSHSDYEFTVTFARVDHEVEDEEVPGVVVVTRQPLAALHEGAHRRDGRQLLEVADQRGHQGPARVRRRSRRTTGRPSQPRSGPTTGGWSKSRATAQPGGSGLARSASASRFWSAGHPGSVAPWRAARPSPPRPRTAARDAVLDRRQEGSGRPAARPRPAARRAGRGHRRGRGAGPQRLGDRQHHPQRGQRRARRTRARPSACGGASRGRTRAPAAHASGRPARAAAPCRRSPRARSARRRPRTRSPRSSVTTHP